MGAEAVIADIGRTIGYPAILRPWAGHEGANSLLGKGPKSVYLVANAQEARDALAEARWPELYAIEYVDLRKKEGWYGKVRANLMSDEIVIQSGGYL